MHQRRSRPCLEDTCAFGGDRDKLVGVNESILEREMIIVSGKGGVGKSAVSAALALRAAASGRLVLVLAMSDGMGLARHLGVEALTYEPHEIRPGIDGSAIDLASALDEYIQLQLHLPRMARLGPAAKAFEVVATAAPGIREVIAMGKPIFEVWGDAYDLVVVDAPPTGQLASFLRAPATIRDLVPPGRVKDQSARMGATLADPERTGLVLVTLAEELPVLETRAAIEEIEKEQLIDHAALVYNRILPPLSVPREVVEQLAPGGARSAALLHHQLIESQREWRMELDTEWELPYLFGLLTPTEVAARLADAWS